MCHQNRNEKGIARAWLFLSHILAAVLLLILIMSIPAKGNKIDLEIPATIAKVFHDAGATELEIQQALVISYKESRWDPDNRNPICCATGLFQITRKTWNWLKAIDLHDYDFTMATDPKANSEVAAALWLRSNKRWYHWSVVNKAMEPDKTFTRVNVRYPLSYVPKDIKEIIIVTIDNLEKEGVSNGCAGT